jgi:hypothetical protein
MHVQSLSVSKDFQFFSAGRKAINIPFANLRKPNGCSTECSIDKINRTCKSYQQPSAKNVPQYIHTKIEAGC